MENNIAQKFTELHELVSQTPNEFIFMVRCSKEELTEDQSIGHQSTAMYGSMSDLISNLVGLAEKDKNMALAIVMSAKEIVMQGI